MSAPARPSGVEPMAPDPTLPSLDLSWEEKHLLADWVSIECNSYALRVGAFSGHPALLQLKPS